MFASCVRFVISNSSSSQSFQPNSLPTILMLHNPIHVRFPTHSSASKIFSNLRGIPVYQITPQVTLLPPNLPLEISKGQPTLSSKIWKEQTIKLQHIISDANNTWLIGPILSKLWNCSYIILKVKFPSESFCKSSGCWSIGTTSWILSMNPDQSPMPKQMTQ